jgi:hypothetical protein
MLGKNRSSLAIPALVLCVALSPVLAQAAPAGDALRSARFETGLFSALIDWVSAWWAPGGSDSPNLALDGPQVVSAPVGCGIDPNGGDTCGDPTIVGPRTDAGSSMDPNGSPN